MKYEYKKGIRDKTKIARKAQDAVIKKSREKFKVNPTMKVGKRGYLLIYIPQQGWKYYHHYVWEKHNGAIPEGYHIHHIDGNKLNNKIENLEIMTESKHHKHHIPKRDESGRFIKI